MAVFNEAIAVQAPLLELLTKLGWRHVPGGQLERPLEDPLLVGELRAALIRLNPVIAEEPARAAEVMGVVRAILLAAREEGLVQANRNLLEWLRGMHTRRFMGRDGYDPVRLIDFEDPAANSLIVSDEVSMGVPGSRCRFDLVLWVNGLPLVVVETKTSTMDKSLWLKAAGEVHDVYERGWPEFFVPNAFSVATDGKELHYGAVRQDVDRWGVWGRTTEGIPAIGWARVDQAARMLLTPAMVLRIVADFAAYETRKIAGVPTLAKILPRYPQVEAVDGIVGRVRSGKSRQGLIVQTQGSGKTIAMMYAAIALVEDPSLRNPSVIVIADRIELVGQMYAQFKRADMPALLAPETSADLRKALAADQRGIIFTTVHKFNQAGVLNTRDNIVVMVDEAHRTQEGQLGKHLRQALPNASFFGFTGTPIADAERNTFQLFGDPEDPGHALNTYDSDRSIADGNTVPMHVSPRLVDFHIDQKGLDEAFEEMVEEEGLDEDAAEYLSRKASHSKTFFGNPERVRAVAADIVEHFYSTVDPLGMKAQVVVYDRELCVSYWEEIARLLAARRPGDEATVVMTSGSKDPAGWKQFARDAQQQEALLDRFRDLHDPLKFLIVTAKLGTGFDAPIEGVMYLDKPMKLHTLYQTITRTNRIWKNPETGQEKKYGLIVDYVGLGDGFARAMAPANPDTARTEIETDALLDQFELELETTLDRFAGIDRTVGGHGTLMQAQQRVPDGRALERFNAQFGLLQGIWEALYPDPRLERREDDYRWLAAVHASIQPPDSDQERLWVRLGAKTLALVHGHISPVSVRSARADVVIADEDTIAQLIARGIIDPTAGSGPHKVVTAGEVVKGIAARLQRRLEGPNGGHAQYRSLAERLEKLRRRQITQAQDSVDWLQEILALAKDLTAAEKAEDEAGQEGLDLLPDPNVGALTQIFEEYRPAETPVIVERVVREIDSIVKDVRYPGWASTREGDRLVRRQLRKALAKFQLPPEGPLFDHAYAYVAENY